MHVHVLATAFELRFYRSEEKGFERGEDYVASCNAKLGVDGVIEISLLSGMFGREAYHLAFDKAREMGFHRIRVRRKGRVKTYNLDRL